LLPLYVILRHRATHKRDYTMTRVTIELEFEGTDLPEDALRESVYAYLEELIQDESLDYTVEEA